MSSLVTYNRLYSIDVGVIRDGSFTTFTSIESPHHIEFKSQEQIPTKGTSFNPARARLFNIGKDNIDFCSYKGASVVIRAGWEYDDGLRLTNDLMETVYIGDIIETYTEQEGGDVVTTLELQEGWNHVVDQFIDKPITIGQGQTAREAFLTVSSSFPNIPMVINFESMNNQIAIKPFETPPSLAASLNQLIKKFSKGDPTTNTWIRITWFFHKGRIYVVDRMPTAGAIRGFYRRHEIPRGRIKGNPRVGVDQTKLTKGFKNGGVKTIELKTYLIPEMSILDTIVLDPADYDDLGGTEYVVTEMSHHLEYDGDAWDTTIKARIAE
ncbi:hypothetical protein VSAK1_26335 [Vibrio mediterranei AK1]|uniref:hypothetical protein n=1 Tax=Vibrio mediterranei TaxID=689 RepID=UPI0001541313|nr:hypothetical protein [Vibrio mediterranei]EDL53761.1 hypothetical protein VSAK1_26335 [Vibrio mediterranei AK1]